MVWSSLSCILSFERESERKRERESERLAEVPRRFLLLRFSSPPRPYRTLPLPVARTEVFVSSPSLQLCYETPSNPIRITDGRAEEEEDGEKEEEQEDTENDYPPPLPPIISSSHRRIDGRRAPWFVILLDSDQYLL